MNGPVLSRKVKNHFLVSPSRRKLVLEWFAKETSALKSACEGAARPSKRLLFIDLAGSFSIFLTTINTQRGGKTVKSDCSWRL